MRSKHWGKAGYGMFLNDLINSQLGPILGAWLARRLSPEGSYRLADWLAARFAARPETALCKAIRANQAVVRGLPYDSPELDNVVGEVLRNAARGYADWFRAIAEGPDYVRAKVRVDEHILEDAWQASERGYGVVFAGAHMSSFNMFLAVLGYESLPIQVLSYHRARGSYKSDNYLRHRLGIDVSPISMESLREAVRRLKQRGFVLTGVDRPDVGGELLNFFGRQVRLPVGHARLAIRTGAHMIVGVVRREGPDGYHVTGPRIIEPVRSGDQKRDILQLAQHVADILAGYIRQSPEEWMMFLPVWPDVIPSS